MWKDFREAMEKGTRKLLDLTWGIENIGELLNQHEEKQIWRTQGKPYREISHLVVKPWNCQLPRVDDICPCPCWKARVMLGCLRWLRWPFNVLWWMGIINLEWQGSGGSALIIEVSHCWVPSGKYMPGCWKGPWHGLLTGIRLCPFEFLHRDCISAFKNSSTCDLQQEWMNFSLNARFLQSLLKQSS